MTRDRFVTPVPFSLGTSEQFSALLRTEVPRWSKIVKDSGASLD